MGEREKEVRRKKETKSEWVSAREREREREK
jgi:hypothetical protein